MKAIIAAQAGSPEVLTIIDTDEPSLQENEVKINVKAFGLNKAETYYRAGNFGPINEKLAFCRACSLHMFCSDYYQKMRLGNVFKRVTITFEV